MPSTVECAGSMHFSWYWGAKGTCSAAGAGVMRAQSRGALECAATRSAAGAGARALVPTHNTCLADTAHCIPTMHPARAMAGCNKHLMETKEKTHHGQLARWAGVHTAAEQQGAARPRGLVQPPLRAEAALEVVLPVHVGRKGGAGDAIPAGGV